MEGGERRKKNFHKTSVRKSRKYKLNMNWAFEINEFQPLGRNWDKMVLKCSSTRLICTAVHLGKSSNTQVFQSADWRGSGSAIHHFPVIHARTWEGVNMQNHLSYRNYSRMRERREAGLKS